MPWPTHHSYAWEDDFTGGKESSPGDIGETGWRCDSGDKAFWEPSEASHPGIISIQTDPSIGSVGFISRFANAAVAGAGEGLYLPSDVQQMVWIARLAQTATTRAFMGLIVDPGTADPNTIDCVGVTYDSAFSANWVLQTRNGASSTRTGSGVAVVANNWYQFALSQAQGTWTLQVNQAAPVSHSTNIPTSLMQPTAQIAALSAAVKELHVDFFRLRTQPIKRFT